MPFITTTDGVGHAAPALLCLMESVRRGPERASVLN